jgi:hypothetical protein
MTRRSRGAAKPRDAQPRPEPVDRFRAQHLSLSTRDVMTADGIAEVMVDDGESPLAWLARRKGRDGQPMISAGQFMAGEKLRADFTRGQLTPRVTSNWGAPAGRRGAGAGAGDMTDMVVASRQRVRLAMEACGPEFSGLLLDVCCFLRGLEEVERERGWPARSAKVVLQLGLDRLARHYGVDRAACGAAAIRSWTAEDAGTSAD